MRDKTGVNTIRNSEENNDEIPAKASLCQFSDMVPADRGYIKLVFGRRQ
jgi:hypothetical protein